MTSSRRKAVLWGVLVLVLVLVSVTVTVLVLTRDDDDDESGAWIEPTPTAEGVPEGLEEFYTQELQWEECGDDQCTTVEVPIDYADPEGETTELAVLVVPATGDGGRSLFVNPGGPGGSAIDYAQQFSRTLPDEAQDLYDVVGVDPRGVGESSPLDCLDDEEFDAYAAADPTPDDPAEIAQLTTLVTELGEGCEAKSGELAGHVSTAEAARDLDVVRALLGQKELDWFGASYGTFLGATYASLFPERVGRMVLDGAIDPTLGTVESSLGQVTGFERAVQAYAASCVQQDDCPLGNDAAAGVERIAGLLEQLDAAPMPTDSDRDLTEGLAFFGIALPLYNEQNWPVLTQALTAAIEDGDGSVLLYLSDQYFQRSASGEYDSNIGEVITAVNCLDALDRPTVADAQDQLDTFADASQVFGRALGWGIAACSAWPFEPAEEPVEIEAEGAAPILVLGTTRDPATPYEAAVALAEQLDSGVLVTRDGDGHTAYQSGNECIADTVNDFLVDGTVPEEDPLC